MVVAVPFSAQEGEVAVAVLLASLLPQVWAGTLFLKCGKMPVSASLPLLGVGAV